MSVNWESHVPEDAHAGRGLLLGSVISAGIWAAVVWIIWSLTQ